MASISITRTNDVLDYSAGDVIGAATGSTASKEFTGLANEGGGSVKILSSRLEVDGNAVISGETSYTLHMYSVAPPSIYGDNVAWDLPAGDRSVYLGSLALGTPVDVGSTLFVSVDNINRVLTLPGRSLFAYLVTVGAYTPTASRVYKVFLETTPG